MTSQIPKTQNYNAFTKVLLLRYNHNHGTHTYVPLVLIGLRNFFIFVDTAAAISSNLGIVTGFRGATLTCLKQKNNKLYIAYLLFLNMNIAHNPFHLRRKKDAIL